MDYYSILTKVDESEIINELCSFITNKYSLRIYEHNCIKKNTKNTQIELRGWYIDIDSSKGYIKINIYIDNVVYVSSQIIDLFTEKDLDTFFKYYSRKKTIDELL